MTTKIVDKHDETQFDVFISSIFIHEISIEFEF